MKVMFDENVAPRVARALRELFPDDEVVHKRERFGPRTDDTDWIAELGRERDWSVISGDRRITRNKAEQAAWLATDLMGFFFEKNLHGAAPPAQAARLIRYWPTIVAQSRTVRGPAMFLLSLGGSPRVKPTGFLR